MSQAPDARSWIRSCEAAGIIHAGHVVEFESNGTVTECNGANTGVGIFVEDETCASGDHVRVCEGGFCKGWADGTSAIVAGAYLAADGNGHLVVEANAGDRVIAIAQEPLASGTAFIDILVVHHTL